MDCKFVTYIILLFLLTAYKSQIYKIQRGVHTKIHKTLATFGIYGTVNRYNLMLWLTVFYFSEVEGKGIFL
jgi:hypothetical protein